MADNAHNHFPHLQPSFNERYDLHLIPRTRKWTNTTEDDNLTSISAIQSPPPPRVRKKASALQRTFLHSLYTRAPGPSRPLTRAVLPSLSLTSFLSRLFGRNRNDREYRSQPLHLHVLVYYFHSSAYASNAFLHGRDAAFFARHWSNAHAPVMRVDVTSSRSLLHR